MKLKPDEIRRIEDPHHPRGYREWVGRRELARRTVTLIDSGQFQRCYVCHGRFTTYNPPTLEHITPKGSGGSTHDDHPENLALSHWRCNISKGSRRI